MSYKKHTDFISDAVMQAKESALVVSSGDGTISVHDLKANKFRYGVCVCVRARKCVCVCVREVWSIMTTTANTRDT